MEKQEQTTPAFESDVKEVVSSKPSKTRFMVLTFLFIVTAINYLDRTNMAVAAPAIKAELGLSPALL